LPPACAGCSAMGRPIAAAIAQTLKVRFMICPVWFDA
jgi:hypothetical protein